VEHVDGQPVGFGGVDPGCLQDLADDSGPVGAMFGEGLSGPFPGDQDPPSAQAQVFAVVGLACAVAGDQPGQGSWARLRRGASSRTPGARQVPQFEVQPVDVRLVRGVDVLAVGSV